MGLERGRQIGIDLGITAEKIKAPIVVRELTSLPKQEIFSFDELKPEGLPEKDQDLRRIAEKPLENQKSSESPDGFEPFEDPSVGGDLLFINGYRGNFSKDMRLNRGAIERVLEIAHLDGKVVLTSLDPSRKRSVDANPDGSITGKRGLLMGQKIEDVDKEPLHRVESTPQGWNIEINDKRMVEELSEKGLSGEKLKKEFVKNFNGFVNQGVFEAVRREKLSGEKDGKWEFKVKLFTSLFQVAWWSIGPTLNFVLGNTSLLKSLIQFSIYYFPFIGFYNGITRDGRKFDNLFEYFMPFVEVDKVARTFAFLKGKGRNLVKKEK